MLLAKRPRLGRVKTRLAPLLGSAGALELYRAFLADQLRFLHSFAPACQLELCLDGPLATHDDLAPLCAGLRRTAQGPGDLGQRLARVFRRGCPAVILGVDSPTLPRDHVARALEALASGTPAVVAPAEDGGYVLIGLSRPIDALFRDVPWGGPAVLAATFEHARSAGVALSRLPGWYDVDDAHGFGRLLAERGSRDFAARAPETAQLLERLKWEGAPR